MGVHVVHVRSAQYTPAPNCKSSELHDNIKHQLFTNIAADHQGTTEQQSPMNARAV